MPTRNLATLIICATISLLCYRTASRNHYGGLLASAIGEINQSFVRPVDDRELFEGAMDGMVRQLDPYSDYVSPKELLEFQEDLDQKFGGIGIVVEVNQDTKRLTVLSPLPDTPAAAAGMRAGDVIVAIDGQNTDGFQIMDAVELMRGTPGTTLVVTVRHPGATETVDMELTRAVIPIASVLGDVRKPDGTWRFTLEQDPRIGYVRVVSFGEKTATELQSTLGELKTAVDGLIIDLRGNGGGLLNAAIAVCDLFIEEGLVVSIRGRDQNDWRDYTAGQNETLLPEMPLVLLINGYSASASEITAACLQDHGRAVVVGQRSWGKGTVQNVMPFEGGKSALKLTVATYWRPSGQNIHRHSDAEEGDSWGVSPNPGHEVEVDEDTFEKILRLRRRRDRVAKEPGASPDTSSPLAETNEELTEDEPARGDQDLGDQDLGDRTSDADLDGFEDPQLKRAIEALRTLIELRTEARSPQSV